MQPATKRKRVSAVRWVVGFVIVVPLVLFWTQLMTGKMQTYKVISASMEPTLLVGDCVLMKKESDFVDLKSRIIVFKDPKGSQESLTKRVVAEGGDIVRLRDGQIYVNDAPEQVSHGDPIENVGNRVWQLNKDEVFVLGDNRNDSFDSIDFGPLNRTQIVGVLTYRYWPAGRVGSLK